MPTRPATSDVQLDEAAVAAQLRLSVTRLARRLRQESGSGYSPSQLSALAVIDNHGPLTLGALADHERVAPPSITKVVAKLEAEGLVQRTTDPSDRRVTHVATTTAGRTLIAETRRRKTTWLTERLRELPDAELARLADAVDVLDHLVAQEERS
jgi:DNA-binding MarR family transcriptional regulator